MASVEVLAERVKEWGGLGCWGMCQKAKKDWEMGVMLPRLRGKNECKNVVECDGKEIGRVRAITDEVSTRTFWVGRERVVGPTVCLAIRRAADCEREGLSKVVLDNSVIKEKLLDDEFAFKGGGGGNVMAISLGTRTLRGFRALVGTLRSDG